MTDFPHGENRGYQRGCREQCCRAAHAAHNRAERVRLAQLPVKQIPHGTRNGNVNYGCRCARCRQADREYHRRWAS